jgi:hypothetical protein
MGGVSNPAYTTYEDGTENSQTSAYKIQMLGNHSKERIQGDQGSIDTLLLTFAKTLFSHSIPQDVFTETTNAEIVPC